MTGNSDLGLNEYLQPINAPITQEGIMSAFDFNVFNDRDIITLSKMGSASVGSAQILSASIGSAQIGTAAIGSANIQTAGIDSANINTVAAGKITAGNITVAVNIGSASAGGTPNVSLDGANNRITIFDGTATRILIGYQSGGF